MVQKFWLGQQEKDVNIHWMKWEKMGVSKCQGDLRFREFESFNKALLAK